jgi:hypothetical protein
MTLTLILFFGSAVAIYLSCEFFVNGVEWVGQRLKITQTATGTILAAFGTALPESVVTFVAIVFGDTDAERVYGSHRRWQIGPKFWNILEYLGPYMQHAPSQWGLLQPGPSISVEQIDYLTGPVGRGSGTAAAQPAR